MSTTASKHRPISFGLRSLLARLQAYRVNWKFSFVPTENMAYEPGTDREKATSLEEANVISSEIRTLTALQSSPRHKVLLDIDYPAYVLESSTPGHHHLYLDVPGGVDHEGYMELLTLLGKLGIIERGYAEVSVARGHSDLRLPWVSKDDQERVLHPCPNCGGELSHGDHNHGGSADDWDF